MTMIVKIVEKKNPINGSVKYYGAPVRLGEVKVDELAERISHACSLTGADVKAVLSALENEVTQVLLDGRSVRLGDLGSFHVTLITEGTETREEWTPANVRAVRVKFIKSAKMESRFAVSGTEVSFASVDSLLTD